MRYYLKETFFSADAGCGMVAFVDTTTYKVRWFAVNGEFWDTTLDFSTPLDAIGYYSDLYFDSYTDAFTNLQLCSQREALCYLKKARNYTDPPLAQLQLGTPKTTSSFVPNTKNPIPTPKK